MEGEGELVEDERAADPERDRQRLPRHVVARVEGDVDHPGGEDDHDPEDHVVDVHVADPAARPAMAAREPRVQPHEGERQQRRAEHQQQRFATREPVTVDLDRIV